MNGNEDDLNIKEEWIGNRVQCDICNHIWIAVYHKDSERLECPNCHNMVLFEIIDEDNRT